MSRSEIAYDYIKHEIINGDLLPGTRISEAQIASQLNISRTPVREALRELEFEGLLISYSAMGTLVSPLDPTDIKETYELRKLFELWALERSINRITDQELDTAEEKFISANKSMVWEEIHEADRYLHKLIVDNALNKRLVTFVNLLDTQIDRMRYISEKAQGRNTTSYDEHMEIIAALRERDYEKSYQALKKHLESVEAAANEVSQRMALYK